MRCDLWPIEKVTRRAALALVAASSLAACAPGRSARPVRLIIGTAAGGGNDGFSRLLAQHLQRLTGLTVQAENEGRAGGRLAASRLLSGPADGSMIAFLPTPLIYENLLAPANEALNLTQFRWLGGIGADRRVLVVNRQSGVTAFDQLLTRTRPLIVAASSTSSSSYVEPRIVSLLTGARLKPVPGYNGGARNLAVLSGEADGVIGDLASLDPILQTPGAKVLLRLNDMTEPASATAPGLAGLARGPDAEALLSLIAATAALGRMFALPPGTPAGILAAWRSRLDQAVADPEFRTAATARGFALEHIPGAEVEATLRRLFAPSSPVGPALRRAMAALGA
ncbi:tripartite tricarboxylate transporter substrate-binding protein [Phenylobacterium sp.]|uniref:tripartite tricarboxylate transporter substrate-binding protein n=1 Tax=Phenylobacterium sp. TaxID=1871053 RepID=UPI0027232630|nr:tripartite tricarboxylate transporter substrate-binding protein [Phenylobacterium sp.]MDO8801739.1 tripartite tricarboxylate transporter substrate-binding protein [Phenylobacterium sp.]